MIISPKVEQYKHEYQTWLRSLEFLQQENIYLKNRLIDIVKKDVSDELLDNAESFNNAFLDKDTVIALLRHEIIEQNNAFNNSNNGSDSYLKKLQKKQNRLREDMNKMESEFSKLKFEFNQYLSSIL